MYIYIYHICMYIYIFKYVWCLLRKAMMWKDVDCFVVCIASAKRSLRRCCLYDLLVLPRFAPLSSWSSRRYRVSSRGHHCPLHVSSVGHCLLVIIPLVEEPPRAAQGRSTATSSSRNRHPLFLREWSREEQTKITRGCCGGRRRSYCRKYCRFVFRPRLLRPSSCFQPPGRGEGLPVRVFLLRKGSLILLPSVYYLLRLFFTLYNYQSLPKQY